MPQNFIKYEINVDKYYIISDKFSLWYYYAIVLENLSG